MPSDIQWFVQELAVFLTQAVEYIQNHRHKYSARYKVFFVLLKCAALSEVIIDIFPIESFN